MSYWVVLLGGASKMHVWDDLRSCRNRGEIPPRELVAEALRTESPLPDDIVEYVADLSVGRLRAGRNGAKPTDWERLRDPGAGWKVRASFRVDQLVAGGQNLTEALRMIADEMALDAQAIDQLTGGRLHLRRKRPLILAHEDRL